MKAETAELSTDEIIAATQNVLVLARAQFGRAIDAKSIDLRLWAAAALIYSTITVSEKPAIMRSLNEKLAVLEK